MSKLSDIEGIGDTYASKLERVDIHTLADLLKACSDPKGRRTTAHQTGISEKLILGWVNRADLARINGISTQYADLLEYAGVDTVPELAQRKADSLRAKMVEVNDERKLVRQLPGLSQLEDWIQQAKTLPRIISH
ncbi:DUF4332 domain-containing protein [Marinobacter halodurans]|uniref:DUF4332 domain-containing protein n=1 Tax=Marinobacter halodurans TaxID=2528979 RepID=A0ABY1ZJR9_9GAMM|nr:DUF4332 domain-containing protein [Marinobacter halodurans]TBW55453.1 DUF4332 domain-containing protein [Marinobacter halodurans]